MRTDSQKVSEKLKVSFPDGPKRDEQSGWLVPPLDVLDCVLSLNRDYDRFCFPRVEKFKHNNPEVDTLQGLLDLIRRYPNPLEFSIQELNYRHEARAVILVQVLEFLIGVQAKFPGSSEGSRLREWAIAAQPADYQDLGIRGFGLAGFQYMRILFGAQTVKPDVHICRFVSDAVERSVGDVEALTLLEIASKHLGWPLGDLDYAIWDKLARSSRLPHQCESKPTLKIAAHYKLERVVFYLENEPHVLEERSQHRGNPSLEVEWAAQQLYFDMSEDEKSFMDHSWGHDSDHNYSDDLLEQTAALEKKIWGGGADENAG
jgi:hypothetical protein